MDVKEHFSQQTQMPLPAKEVFDWHTRPGAFERLSPPWIDMQIVERTGGIENGAQVGLLIHQGPFFLKWTLAHKNFQEGKEFTDYQVSGPFAFWEQVHSCEPIDQNTSFLKDFVEYELPLHAMSRSVGVPMIQHELRRLFRYRHRLMVDDCQSLIKYERAKPRKIVVTGSTGLIGRHIIPFFWTQKCQVLRLVRPSSDRTEVVRMFPNPEPTFSWDPQAGSIDKVALENVDAVLHLAGDNVGKGRWNDEKKERLRESRMASTRLLVDTILAMKQPPKVFICASAIGYYGDRGDEILDESKTVGKGFLASLCEEWESITAPLSQAGVRVVNLRIGVVLSPKGGALGAMLPAFQAGGGGPIGPGSQYLSWISPDDLAGAIYHCISTESISGPVNLVAPNPVQNKKFAETLGHVLFRPAFLPMPAMAARILFGEFADEALLASARVTPKKLIESGYVFRDPDLETALKCQLGG